MKPYVPLVAPSSPPKSTNERPSYKPLVMEVVKKYLPEKKTEYEPQVVEVAKQCLPNEETVVKLLQGKQGLPGPTANPGPGFKLVGVELRYDIATLPRG